MLSDDDSEDEDAEEERRICNMSGDHWESLPYPIIIDSGACASVIPTSWCKHIPVEEAEKSKAIDFFRAENG